MKRFAVMLAVSALLMAGMTVPASAATTITVNALADTYVSSGDPNTNFGGSVALRIDDAAPTQISYLRFDVTGIPAGATNISGSLRIEGTGASQPTGTVRVHKVLSNSWNSQAVTYSTRPAYDAAALDSAPMGAGVTANLDVPVAGNGQVSFALTRSTTGAANAIGSKENTLESRRPVLFVTYDDPVVVPPANDLPYGADSFYQSRVDGVDVPINETRTTQFQQFMATHPEQAAITWPKVNMNANWAMSYDYGTADDPIWKLAGGNTNDSRLQILTTQGFHMDDSVASSFPTGTQDRPGVIFDEVFGYTVQFADAVPNMSTRTITVSNAGIMWHDSNGLDYRNPLSDDNRNFTSRGRILDAMVVTREELDAAVAAGTGVGHVLHWYFVETNTADGHVHPMVGDESNKSGFGAEGERLRIKPDVDLAARGLSGHALALALTMQENGAYLGDNSGSGTQIKLSQADKYTGTNLTVDVFKGKLSWTDFEVVEQGWQ